MNQEKRNCQNCTREFQIESEDFDFYKKIDVPPPTFCPGCRLQRRMSFSNERILYKRKCNLCERDTISLYDSTAPFPVYCIECWRGDKWDPMKHGMEYDFSKSFFEQFKELKNRVPRMALIQQGNMVGSEYTNRASNNKNCYLIFRGNFNEDCSYSQPINECNDVVDCINVQKCEGLYDCIDCINCYNLFHSQECKNCNDSCFLYDCRGCNDCFGCVGLRNKKNYIFNKPYSAEDYKEKKEQFLRGGMRALLDEEKKFRSCILEFIHPWMMSTQSENSTGNWLYECRNAMNAYGSRNIEDSKHLTGIIEAKDCMDYYYWGRGSELVYETANCGLNSSRIICVNESWVDCSNLTYTDSCVSCQNCFGCVGLQKKQYCVFNKQYTEQKYKELVGAVIKQMNDVPYTDSKGRIYKYGEFFPTELAPCAYNETAAQEYFPFTKEEALEHGFRWKDAEEKLHKPTMSWRDLPNTIDGIGDDILKAIILCEAWEENQKSASEHNCTKAFRIIPQELEFYKKQNIPLPRKCPNSRHYERFEKRNKPQLHHRECQCGGAESDCKKYKNTVEHVHKSEHCSNKFETTHAPKRPEIVYCEQCYRAEVA